MSGLVTQTGGRALFFASTQGICVHTCPDMSAEQMVWGKRLQSVVHKSTGTMIDCGVNDVC